MWSRVLEIAIGCWLWMSPFIFRYDDESFSLWINDYVSGGVCFLFACLSCYRPWKHLHLVNAVLGAWLVGYAFANAGWPVAPPLQNYVILGLLLLMLGIIPNEADQPPEAFRESLPNDAS